MSRPHAPGADEGFTLVELLISISILVIILSAITSALLVFLANGEYATARDDHSAGASLLSTYLNRDLSSADSTVAISVVGPSGSTCAGSNNVTLTWREFAATPAVPVPAVAATYTAAYTVSEYDDGDAGTPPRCQLARVYSKNGTVLDTVVLTTSLSNGTGTAASPFAITAVSDATSSGRCRAATATAPAVAKLTVTMSQYEAETSAPFVYVGCIQGRVL
jgi:prepilin-type N-terminal cleavage/methylation domain-containing protein